MIALLKTSIRRPLTLLFLPAFALAIAACGGSGDSPAGPDRTPTISVSGVADGGIYDAPVEIEISVDQGSYLATLNGTSLIGASHTVTAAGDYILAVTARNGIATSQVVINFAIRGGTAGPAVTIRLLDLGANDSGGGGDAVLITDTVGGRPFSALIDAGPAGMGGSNEDFVAQRLRSLGVDTLDLLILSHAHSDHFAGIDEVLGRVHVRRFFYNGQVRSLGFYRQVLNAAQALADTVIVPDSVHRYQMGINGAEVVILPPLQTFLSMDTNDGSDLNEGSLGVLVQRGGSAGFQMFLTGDGEVAANQRWRTQFGALTGDVEVLKVGHHGANDAVFDNGSNGGSAWLQHTSPEAVVISANGTTHARVRALGYLNTLPGVVIRCTSIHGDLLIRGAADGSFSLTPSKNEASPCVPGSEATTDLHPLH